MVRDAKSHGATQANVADVGTRGAGRLGAVCDG